MRSILIARRSVGNLGPRSHFISKLSWLFRSRIWLLILLPLVLIGFILAFPQRISQDLSVKHGKVTNDGVLMYIPRCDCLKTVPHPSVFNDGSDDIFHRPIQEKDTTCSQETFVRGPGQKVVAFTFYENDPNAKHTKVDPFKDAMKNADPRDKMWNAILSHTDGRDDDKDGSPLSFEEQEDKQQRKLRGYLQGIKENIALVKALYPTGFTVRLYYEVLSYEDNAMRKLCHLACNEPMFDLCDPGFNPKLGNSSILYPLIWRFLPAIDRHVDVFFSRDLDSRVSPREAACVSEFLSSNYSVHVMRDHPAHSAPMMGGLWGAKVKEARPHLLKAFKKLFKDGIAYFTRYVGMGYDQHALTRYVWPWAKKSAMCHDSYNCKSFSKTFPFPTRREENEIGNYVGSVVLLNATIDTECPFKCRPADHKDWTKC